MIVGLQKYLLQLLRKLNILFFIWSGMTEVLLFDNVDFLEIRELFLTTKNLSSTWLIKFTKIKVSERTIKVLITWNVHHSFI